MSSSTDLSAAVPVRFSMPNKTINVGAQGYDLGMLPLQVTFSDPLSGFDYAYAYFKSPSQSQTLTVTFAQSSLQSGSLNDGTYAPNWGTSLNAYAEKGHYTLDYIYTKDRAGNEKVFHASDLVAHGVDPQSLQFQVTGNAPSDLTPLAPVKFELANPTIFVGSEGYDLGNLKLAATFSDALSGFETSYFYYKTPSHNGTVTLGFDASSLSSGSLNYGTFHPSFGTTLNQYAEKGEYTIDYLYTKDKAGNINYVYGSDLIKLGIDPASLSFLVTGATPTSDRSAALPVKFDWSQQTIAVGPEGFDLADLPMTATFSDNLSGFDTCYVYYKTPSQNGSVTLGFGANGLETGSLNYGSFHPNYGTTLNPYSEKGQYTLDYLYIKDQAGNEKILYVADLKALGLDPASLAFNVAAAPISTTASLNGEIVPFSGDMLVDAMTNGYRWDLDTSHTIKWSISNGWNKEYWTYPQETLTTLGQALGSFSDFANLHFEALGSFASPSAASAAGSDINFASDGAYKYFSTNSAWAMGFFPKPNDPNRGDIYLNLNSQANHLDSYEPGSAGFFVAMHEIGHTLGLKHPHDDGGTGRPTFQELGWSSLDVDFVSIMSYQDEYNWNLREWDPATPMAADVLALQYLYGKNMTTHAGDTTFHLSKTNFYASLWDSSGLDRIDQTQASEAWHITLPNLQLSTKVDTLTGFAVPKAELLSSSPQTLYWLLGDIENVDGSRFGDEIFGNDLNNTIKGAGGDDSIDGGAGLDTVTFSGARSDYTITLTDHAIRVSDGRFGSPDGTDMISACEFFAFSDGVLTSNEITSFKPFDAAMGAIAAPVSVFGTPGADRLVSTPASEALFGDAGNDVFMASTGADTIAGGNGFDQVVYGKAFHDFSIHKIGPSQFLIDHIQSQDGSELISDIEKLVFTDAVVSLDEQGHAAQAFRLYQAALDRTPDQKGLEDWIKYLDDGHSLPSMAQHFIDSQEFRTKYGSLNDEAFVNQLYRNVLDRAGEASGIADWVNGLAHGLSRAEVLQGFSESAENQANVIGQIETGITYHDWLSA